MTLWNMEFSQVVHNDYISFSEQFADVPSRVNNCPVFWFTSAHVPHHSFFPNCTEEPHNLSECYFFKWTNSPKPPQCHLPPETPSLAPCLPVLSVTLLLGWASVPSLSALPFSLPHPLLPLVYPSFWNRCLSQQFQTMSESILLLPSHRIISLAEF